jgi:acylpyruvate hydrolase
MKLVTFTHSQERRIGVLHEVNGKSVVVDLNKADPSLPTDMLTFLAGGTENRALAESAVSAAPPQAILELSAVKLNAPIPNPGKILCLGVNYRDHADESSMDVPAYPIVFSKHSNTVIGPGDAITLSPLSEQTDYEAEFGVVIGRQAKSVSKADAFSYVAGYLPFHDVSARDYQHRTSQWTLGKSFDTFGPMGPALVTADEVPDPANLDITLRLNGEVMQSSNTRYLIFSVPDLIAEITSVMTLEPGDLISTGTPGGVGAARTPPIFLKAGDLVEVEIEGLGVLSNPVV